jgi:hypothetical protein
VVVAADREPVRASRPKDEPALDGHPPDADDLVAQRGAVAEDADRGTDPEGTRPVEREPVGIPVRQPDVADPGARSESELVREGFRTYRLIGDAQSSLAGLPADAIP